jgi:hypothetical protein
MRTFCVALAISALSLPIAAQLPESASQNNLEPGSGVTASSHESNASVNAGSILRLQPIPSSISDGTNGDIYLNSPAPFGVTGVLLRAKASWPYVVAQTGTANSGSGFLVYNSATVELMRVTGEGNVGMGTSSPLRKLDIRGDVWIGGTAPSLIIGLAPNDNFRPAIYSYASTWANDNFAFAINDVQGTAPTPTFTSARVRLRAGNSASGPAMHFDTRAPSGTYQSKVTLTTDGKLGIGTSSPQQALDVVGNINVTGNINAKYQDVAEWVPATSDLVPGTVVVLDTERANTVRASSSSYSTAVAGVVSIQPGITLGEAGEGKEMVATTGRVRVRVDATEMPIRVADLLVTGKKPGTAIRSAAIEVQGRAFHQPGTIIGKALEPLESGEGEILVLLSLQ